jgi:hypothetical protein
MRIACWTLKATITLSEYVIHTAFPMQKRLHQRTPLLPYTYIARLFAITFMHAHILEVDESNSKVHTSEKIINFRSNGNNKV